MSNKTEVLSFDDALNKHKRLLTESLVNFDEGQRVRKIVLDIESNSADYEYYFQSGQQSKQAEVDELKWLLRNSNAHADDFCRKSIELHKLIDRALIYIEPSDDISHKAYRDLYKILKGEETK